MNSGLYAACAALIARTGSLEIAANNLANTATDAYKTQKTIFRSLLTQHYSQRSLGRAINDFAVLGNSSTDFAQGNLDRTGNQLDCAIDGPGFFTVRTKEGIRYTRNGRFQIASNREFTTLQGDEVMGQQGPIRLPNGTLSISSDGTISVDGALVGKLKIVEPTQGADFKAEGRTYYTTDPESMKQAVNSVVKQGTIEISNVNPVLAAVDLVTLQRHAELLERTLSIFNSDMNRVATEELSRT